MFDIKVTPIAESKKPNEGSFLQTPFWCSFKQRHGWSYSRFLVEAELNSEYQKMIEDEGCSRASAADNIYKKTFELAILNRSFAKGIFNICYIPLAPALFFKCTDQKEIDAALEGDENSVFKEELVTPETQTIEFAHFIKELSLQLKKELPANTILIRYDPDITFYNTEDRDLFNYGLRTVAFADKIKLKKSKVDIQPPDSTLVDLTCSEDEMLSRMHAKWRYNIRLSEKKGVIVKKYLRNDINLSEKLDKFYELTKETNARDGNARHALSYYKDLITSSIKEIEEGKDSPLVSLYIAEHESEEIASIMTLFSKTESIYLYGASSNKKRNLMPNHLLQWTAMKDAKAYGSSYYDMYGMPPEGKDEKHPMHGLYMFKANFGGQNIHRTGSWDYPLKAVYGLYKMAEVTRAWWHKKVIKKLKGR